MHLDLPRRLLKEPHAQDIGQTIRQHQHCHQPRQTLRLRQVHRLQVETAPLETTEQRLDPPAPSVWLPKVACPPAGAITNIDLFCPVHSGSSLHRGTVQQLHQLTQGVDALRAVEPGEIARPDQVRILRQSCQEITSLTLRAHASDARTPVSRSSNRRE